MEKIEKVLNGKEGEHVLAQQALSQNWRALVKKSERGRVQEAAWMIDVAQSFRDLNEL